MIRTVALGLVAVVGLVGADAPTGEGAREAYREAKAAAGRGADAQVRLALWCEAHGLEAERIRHLAVAVLTDPTNATARGLLGLVEYRGKWSRPDEVAAKVKSDERLAAALAEYNGRRARLRNRADDHYALALWAEANGLTPEAQAHFTIVTRLDPSKESAWKHLGFVRHDGRWMTAAQIASAKAEAEARRQADRRWRPLLERWREWLGDRNKARRDEAEARLAEVADPRAVPSIWAVFGMGTPDQQRVAAGLFAQLDGAAASQSLAILAIRSKSPAARRVAAEALRRRDPREFVDFLIAQVRKPLKYEVKPVGGQGSPGVLFIEGERYDVRRLYETPTFPLLVNAPKRLFAPDIPYVPFASDRAFMLGLSSPWNASVTGAPPAINSGGRNSQSTANSTVATMTGAALQADALIVQTIQTNIAINRLNTAIAESYLETDIATVDAFNTDARAINDVATSLLKDATGQDLGDDPRAWRGWWTDQKGYAMTTDDTPAIKPTYTEIVPLPGIQPHHACFAAGTPVRTLDGLRPIESIRAGDRVVAQDPKTGALGYRPVVAAFHNPPNGTLAVKFPDEEVVATGIHRFWKAGKGWVMARDLAAGDEVRALGGTAKVVSIAPEKVQPVFNLEVADGHSFLVGRSGLLVHDNSLVEPTPEPFDAPPALASASKSAP